MTLWSRGLVRSHGYIISSLPQCPWLTNMTRRSFTLMGSCPKVTWPFNHVVLWDQPIFTVEVLMVTKVGKLVTGHEGLPFMLLHPLVTWCCQITWQTNTYISTTGISMTTKLGRVVAYFGSFLLCEYIITWFLWDHMTN